MSNLPNFCTKFSLLLSKHGYQHYGAIILKAPRCLTSYNMHTSSNAEMNTKSSEYLTQDEEFHRHDENGKSDATENLFGGHKLYPGHIPTSLFQKVLLSVGSAAVAIADPSRGDMVATMGETTGYIALVKMREKMLADPIGRQILEERPRINTKTVDMTYLHSLPDDTFGKKYATWLAKNSASPDERLPVSFVDDPELAYVMQRYREVHDLFHTILGMPTHMLGEVVVKWVEALQTGLPMCAMAALFGPLRLRPKHWQKFVETHIWWGIRNGTKASFLMNVYYEKYWEWTLDDLREELNLEPPPATPEKMGTSS